MIGIWEKDLKNGVNSDLRKGQLVMRSYLYTKGLRRGKTHILMCIVYITQSWAFVALCAWHFLVSQERSVMRQSVSYHHSYYLKTLQKWLTQPIFEYPFIRTFQFVCVCVYGPCVFAGLLLYANASPYTQMYHQKLFHIMNDDANYYIKI